MRGLDSLLASAAPFDASVGALLSSAAGWSLAVLFVLVATSVSNKWTSAGPALACVLGGYGCRRGSSAGRYSRRQCMMHERSGCFGVAMGCGACA